MPEILGTSKSIYAFDPRSLGGCVLWLDGADGKTLYSNSGGTILATVGGQVQLWKDKSGAGNNFSNRSAGSGYYPTYASGGGVSIVNAGSPIYNASTYICLQSVTNFMAFPYYTVYTVVNATVSANRQLPTLFGSIRNPSGESRSPQLDLGSSFSLGGPGVWSGDYTNARLSFGEWSGVSSEQVSNSVTTVVGLTSGKLSNSTSVAGTRVGSAGSSNYVPYTTCTAPAFIGGCFYLYNAGTADNRWLNGTIFETLVFNSELTIKQCQEIEGYLSWKWGRQTALPTTHPFYSIAPLARVFTPIDIPGCQLWLDAADAASVNSGSISYGGTVTTWADKSGCSNNATANGSPTWSSNIFGGLPAMSLANGPRFLGTFSPAIQTSSLSVFAVAYSLQTSGVGHDQRLVSMTSNASSANDYNSVTGIMPFDIQTNNLTTYYNGTVATNNALSANTRFVASMVASNTSINAWLNGTPFTTTGVTTTSLALNSAAYGVGGDAWTSGAEPWFGYIGEVIIYSNALTTVQRQAVEGYLAWKWGLNTSLSTSNLLYMFPPSSVQQFNPTDINACSLWLDAADLTGSTISTWNDKSGNGSNATANSAITILANAVNGNNVLSVTSGTPRYLNGSITITGKGLTVISAFRMDSGSSNSAHTIGLGVSGANDTANISYVGICRQSGSSNMGPNRNGSYAGPLLTYGVPAISTTYFDGANGFSYINGGTASSFASTANFGITSYTIMANTSNADSTSYFTGYMCEMIVYNSTLTLAERQRVEGYLSRKWAISLATTHPYYAINTAHMAGGTAIITPSNVPNLVVWNRGDTLSVGNGNTINTWTNSSNTSGPTITCTGTQSNAALNGLSVANLTTAQTWTSSTALTPTSFTFIQVSRQVPSTYGRMFQSTIGNHLHGYWNGYKQTWYNEGWLVTATAGAPSSETEWAIVTSTRIAGGAYECRWNGSVISTGTTSSSSNLGGLAVNAGTYPGEASSCQIAEVILYSNVLTKPTIIGIEEYLRQKWGLGLN